MSSSSRSETIPEGVGWDEDSVRRILPWALMNLRSSSGVRLGPRPNIVSIMS